MTLRVRLTSLMPGFMVIISYYNQVEVKQTAKDLEALKL